MLRKNPNLFADIPTNYDKLEQRVIEMEGFKEILKRLSDTETVALMFGQNIRAEIESLRQVLLDNRIEQAKMLDKGKEELVALLQRHRQEEEKILTKNQEALAIQKSRSLLIAWLVAGAGWVTAAVLLGVLFF